jgi:hypothetical protein
VARRLFVRGEARRSVVGPEENAGDRVVAALGEQGARELLEILERPDTDRASLIGRLYLRDDARWLAEILIDLEDDSGEMARSQMIDGLRCVLGKA